MGWVLLWILSAWVNPVHAEELHSTLCSESSDGSMVSCKHALNLTCHTSGATLKAKRDTRSKYPAVKMIVNQILELSKIYPELTHIRVVENEDGLPTLRFSHGAISAARLSSPMKKGGSVLQLTPDGYAFSLVFYRGAWHGAALFSPIRLGGVNLWYQKRLGKSAGVHARRIIQQVDGIIHKSTERYRNHVAL